jgi:NAD-dependent dihydropyrimidine dehydrogenase PreA subunit
MTYVIAEPCIGTKDTACVEVCPVDCIHPTKTEPEYATAELLYINPDECIDCGACVPDVGDSRAEDVAGARGAGLKAVLLDRKAGRSDDEVVAGLDAVMELVAGDLSRSVAD